MEGSEKRVVRPLLRDGCQGTVAAGKDGWTGQREDALEIVPALFEEVGAAAADGTGEKRIADDREGLVQAFDYEAGEPG